MPRHPPTKPFIKLPSPDVREEITIPMITVKKYSLDPNPCRMALINGMTAIRVAIPITVPIIEHPAEMPIARPACPDLAIGYPSRTVVMLATLPGMFIKIDVTEPP
jgi:hypothetical protein